MVTGVTSISAVWGDSAFDVPEDFEDEAEVFDDAAEDEFEAADEAADEACPSDDAFCELDADEAAPWETADEVEPLAETDDLELPFPAAPQPVKVSVNAAANERNSVRAFFRFDIFSPSKIINTRCVPQSFRHCNNKKKLDFFQACMLY